MPLQNKILSPYVRAEKKPFINDLSLSKHYARFKIKKTNKKIRQWERVELPLKKNILYTVAKQKF